MNMRPHPPAGHATWPVDYAPFDREDDEALQDHADLLAIHDRMSDHTPAAYYQGDTR
jgi:hypothetical protein